MPNNLFKKFLSFSYGSWVGLIIGLLSTMITTRILVPEDFGKASMFTLAVNVMMIFIIFGTDQSFVRFFYEEKEGNRGGLLYNCLRLPMLLTVVVIPIILLFYKRITHFLFDEENLTVALMLALAIFSYALHGYGILVIRMQQKGNLYSLDGIFNKVLNLAFIMIFYQLLGANYQIIIYSTLLTGIILTVAELVIEKTYWHPRNASVKSLRHSKREIINYSYPLVITTLISWLFSSFDRLAIRQWSTLVELGLYAGATRIVELLIILQGTFTTFWVPVRYEHYEKNPDDKVFFERMSRVVSFAMFFVAIFSIAAKDLIVLLLGADFRESANLMPFLVFMPILYTVSETTVIGIGFAKKPKWEIFIAGVSCAVNIIGNWWLVPIFGALGASISTAFSYVVFFTIRTQISLKYYKVHYELKKIYGMLALISVYALFAAFNYNTDLNTIAGIGAMVVLTAVYWNVVQEGYAYLRKTFSR